MTAETDALRLVPVNARDLDALRYVLNRADEASRIRTVMSTFTLPERETTAERLERLYAALKAAAPAVQPAAGREEIARAVYDWVRDDAPVGLKMQMGPEIAAKLIDRLSALAHPPAQGSESGGDYLLPMIRELATKGADKAGCDGWRAQEMCLEIVKALDRAALSQPGPASEGDGE